MSGKMEAFYQEALLCCKDFDNCQLHDSITRKLAAWCRRFKPNNAETEAAADEAGSCKKGDVVDVAPLPGDAVHSTPYIMSEGEEEEESAAATAAAAAASAAGSAAVATRTLPLMLWPQLTWMPELCT
jgi:hypothetical protein